MDFTLSEEQTLLRDNVQRFVARQYSIEERRRIAAKEQACSPANWKLFAEMGWLGLTVPERFGGLGFGPTEYAIVQEQLGTGLVLEPFLELGVVAPRLLLSSADEEKITQLLPNIIAGNLKLALAHGEAHARGEIAHVETRAERAGEGWTLQGHKTLVRGGAASDGFIVSARTSGQGRDDDGITLFLVGGEAEGLRRVEVGLTDDSRAADLTFDGLAVDRSAVIGPVGRGLSAIRDAMAWYLLGLCAEAIGAMDRATVITRDYLKTRKQFGVAIGSFQALQHRMADMLIETELSRSILFRALAEFDAPIEREITLSAAKAQIGKAAFFVGSQAVQLHGGIGMADDYVIGSYFKRLHMIQNQCGSVHHHLLKVGALLSDETAP